MNTDTTHITDITYLVPLTLLALGSVVSLLSSTIRRGYLQAFWANIIFLTLTAFSILLITLFSSPYTIGDGFLHFDPLSKVASLIIMLSGILVTLNLRGNDRKENVQPEIYPLLMFSLIGMYLLVNTTNLIMMFVALEMMTLAVYVLVAMRRHSAASSEASVKYFIMGGVAASSFLYGSALVFGCLQTTNMASLAHLQTPPTMEHTYLLIAGLVLILSSLLFKIGAFPFHAWVPEIYQGAMTSVTGFMASLVKFSVFILLMRLSSTLFTPFIYQLVALAAVLTMIYGNLLALLQTKIKRILAFSSISHTGYLLIGICALENTNDQQAILFYLTCYLGATIGAFSLLSLLPDNCDLQSLKGFGFKHPYLAGAFSLFLLSFAGLPCSAGLMAKYFLFLSAIDAVNFTVLVVAILASMLSLYYYLRIIISMFTPVDITSTTAASTTFLTPSLSPLYATFSVITVAVLFIFIIGFVPTPLWDIFHV